MPGSSPGGGKTRAITAVHPMESAPARPGTGFRCWATWPPASPSWPRSWWRITLTSTPRGGLLLPCGSGGESMIGAGILPGDLVIVRRQPTALNGEIVIALIGGGGHLQAVLPPGRPCLAAAGEPDYQPIDGTFARFWARSSGSSAAIDERGDFVAVDQNKEPDSGASGGKTASTCWWDW